MFDSNYEVILADNSESRDIHFNIRYQVYCNEKGFENPSPNHDAIEVDEFDGRSAHFIVRCKRTGDWVAAMRLVLGSKEELPFVLAHNVKLSPSYSEKRGDFLEISRMCVLNQYRGKNLKRNADHKSKKSDVRRECEIMLGLIRAVYSYGKFTNINHGAALMTAPLARILKRSGFSVDVMGEGFFKHTKTKNY